MSAIHYTQFALNETNWFINYIKDNIAAYHISELTNGICGDVPSINGAHPLALEYGNMLASTLAGSENYSSILPAIGVEFIDDNEFDRQPLGSGHQSTIITQTFLTQAAAVSLKDRMDQGIIMSKTALDAIQAAKTAKGTAALYAEFDRYIENRSMNISIWSNNIDITRIVYLVLKALLKRAKRALSTLGVKNLKVDGQGSIYNYDFGTTLFGAEFRLAYIAEQDNIEVDDTISVIGHIEEKLETGIPANAPGVTFVEKTE